MKLLPTSRLECSEQREKGQEKGQKRKSDLVGPLRPLKEILFYLSCGTGA
jgi:hypothetical protein